MTLFQPTSTSPSAAATESFPWQRQQSATWFRLGHTRKSVFLGAPASLCLHPLSDPHPSLLSGVLHAPNPSLPRMHKWLVSSPVSPGAHCVLTGITLKGCNYRLEFPLLQNPCGSITRALEPSSSLKSPPDNLPYSRRRPGKCPVLVSSPTIKWLCMALACTGLSLSIDLCFKSRHRI